MKLGKRKCKFCLKTFQKEKPLQSVCNYKCGIGQAKKLEANKKEKVKKSFIKERKEALKSRSTWAKEAQTNFNRYICLRDINEPCISCGTKNRGIQYAAGHYLTVGAMPELRFEEDNVHKQCNKNCNMMLSGNLILYRRNLILKIGIKRVEWLEGPHELKKYTIEQLKEIKKLYASKARKILKERERLYEN